MTSPPVDISGGSFIPPRQPGETAYAYRYRRSVTLFGQTPYERRIFLAQRRGQNLSEARGHGRQAGRTESQIRAERFRERIGFDISESAYRAAYAENWLRSHGYTPEITGMSWTQLLRLEPRLRYMYNATGPGGRVTPAMIAEATRLEATNQLERGWAFERLWRKYEDMLAYREFRDRRPGAESWAEYQAVHDFVPSLAIQWWFYR